MGSPGHYWWTSIQTPRQEKSYSSLSCNHQVWTFVRERPCASVIREITGAFLFMQVFFKSFFWWTWHITFVPQIPSNLTNQDILSFSIQVLLPQTSSSTIDNFVTYLPLFSQYFGDFRKHGKFNQINIEGASQNMSCTVGRWCSVHAWRWLLSVFLVLACLSDICEKHSCANWRHLHCHRCSNPWHNWRVRFHFYNQCLSIFITCHITSSIDANITLVQSPTCPKPTLLSIDTGLRCVVYLFLSFVVRTFFMIAGSMLGWHCRHLPETLRNHRRPPLSSFTSKILWAL